MDSLFKLIQPFGIVRNYKSGTYLFSAGDKAEGFYYIKNGEVRIYKMDEHAREVEVAHLSKGEFLGEAIVFISDIFTVFAQVVKQSTILFFPKYRILKEIDNNPAIAKAFLNILSHKCSILNKRLEELTLKSVRQRLVQYLISSCTGKNICTIELKIKKGELAKRLGTINETLSRNFKQLQDEDLIEINGSIVHIKNCLALKKELM